MSMINLWIKMLELCVLGILILRIFEIYRYISLFMVEINKNLIIF